MSLIFIFNPIYYVIFIIITNSSMTEMQNVTWSALVRETEGCNHLCAEELCFQEMLFTCYHVQVMGCDGLGCLLPRYCFPARSHSVLTANFSLKIRIFWRVYMNCLWALWECSIGTKSNFQIVWNPLVLKLDLHSHSKVQPVALSSWNRNKLV